MIMMILGIDIRRYLGWSPFMAVEGVLSSVRSHNVA